MPLGKQASGAQDSTWPVRMASMANNFGISACLSSSVSLSQRVLRAFSALDSAMESKAAKAFFSDTPRFGMLSSGALESHERRPGGPAQCAGVSPNG
eukprot:6834249-Lingulodinium_polyedra.AAC.1